MNTYNDLFYKLYDEAVFLCKKSFKRRAKTDSGSTNVHFTKGCKYRCTEYGLISDELVFYKMRVKTFSDYFERI